MCVDKYKERVNKLLDDKLVAHQLNLKSISVIEPDV